MLADISHLRQVLWAANVAVEATLAALLVVRKSYRSFPVFSLYLLVDLAMSAAVFFVYHLWGIDSSTAYRIAWGAQGVVLFARALAVAEVCRHLLSRYRGVWALTWRILLLSAAAVLSFSILAARRDWTLALLTADRGLELSIATVIVVLLLFVRYYEVKVEPVARSLAIGFCLFSCSAVLNNTVLESWLHDYSALWSLLGMLAFLASLSIWTWALRHSQSEAQPKEILLPSGIYQAVAPEINLRLRLFNEQLSRFWKVEAGRS